MSYADDIRVEQNAHTMRGLIADGIEENKSIADSANAISQDAKEKVDNNDNRINNILSGQIVGKDQEVVDSHHSNITQENFNNLGERFDGIDSTLADSANRLNNMVIDVRHPMPPFAGLKCDGVTDDTINFKAIANFLMNGNRTVLLFPLGSDTLITDDINIHRNTSLLSFHTRTRIFTTNSSQVNIKVKGDSGSWLQSIAGLTLDKVGILYGETSTDYGNGCVVKDCEIKNCTDKAILYRFNSWQTTVDNVKIHDNNYGVYFDFITAISNSGAAMKFSNVDIFNNIKGMYVNGVCTDGFNIQLNNTNIEHNDTGLETLQAGGGIISANNLHLELNRESHITLGGSYFHISNINMSDLGNATPTPVAEIILKTGNLFINSGSIGCSISKLLKKIGGAITIDGAVRIYHGTATNIISSSQAITSDSTSNVSIKSGFIYYSDFTTKIIDDYIIDTLIANDSSERKYDLSVNVSNNADYNGFIRVYINPGGTEYVQFPITSSATNVGNSNYKIIITYTPGRMIVEAFDMTQTHTYYLVKTSAISTSIARYITIDLVNAGTGILKLNNQLNTYIKNI